MEADKRVKHKNPHLEEMKDDVLYHIGLNTKQELKQMFGDVKVILSMKKLRENITRYLTVWKIRLICYHDFSQNFGKISSNRSMTL